jgi:ABC-type glycerol-3-phosphate transport system substrate-binding protein
MESKTHLTRRDFLKLAAVASTGALVAACAPAATPAPAPTAAPAAKQPAAPTAAPATAVPPTKAPAPPVAPTTAPAAKKVTLRWATNYVGNHAMMAPTREILKKFQADFPNVTIEIEESPGNDHQTKIKLDASSDRLPDVFNYWRMDPAFGLDQIVDAGKVADLSEWTKSDAFFKDLFDDSAWRTASRNNKVHGIPTLMFFVQFIANKEVLDRAGVKPPSSYEELAAAVKALKAKGELPWGMAAKNGGHTIRGYNYVFNRMFGNARALNIHAGKEPYNVPEAVKAAELIKELFIGNIPEDAIALDENAVLAKYINTSKAAFVIDGSWENPNITKETQEKMLVLEFPLVPGGAEKEKGIEKDLTNLWYVGAKSWADADKQPVIKELLKRLSSRDAGKLYAEVGQQPIPMRGTVVDPAKVGKLAEASQKLAQERPGNKYIPTVMSPDVSAKFGPLVAEFFNGKYPPDKFVEEMAKVVKV